MITSDELTENLSPFELSLFLEKKLHEENHNLETLLNAGRGNPNWTAPTPREAFFLLGQFATKETLREGSEQTAGMIQPSFGRTQRFLNFLAENPSKGATFLQEIWTAEHNYFGMDKEMWLDAMLDYVIGDNYPNPVRCLKACEQPIKAYLNQELFSSEAQPFDIFAVEGGTAGICYLFDTLANNYLLEKGDRIALLLPTFAPYLEIPELPRYDFDVVKIKAEQMIIDGKTTYQYSNKEIDKLKDPSIKAVFVVNPSNPTANAMGKPTIEQIKQIVAVDNPKLMILTDDVYGTFVPAFRSLFTELPYNTACIYSYSKYFGATGWRVGTIAVSQENIFDQLLKELPVAQKMELQARYATLNADTSQINFISRLVADSRDIALNHAAGLSSIQQAMMALFSLYALLKDGQAYKDEVMDICHTREKLLFRTLGIEEPLASLNTAYYCEINFRDWTEKRYGPEFSSYLTKSWTITKVLTSLAEKEKLMLLKADAFGSDKWSVRISLANLATNQYSEVGKRMIRLSEHIKEEWLRQKRQAIK
ncbi:TPA: aspartate 4-decarboxylase [Enterococcus faecalis]|uniref:aspartate 4-decarboxylase n=1 Tax=Enterococcus TaxID=1350 RepID=UPI0003305934|nr:aspartate 4-decarboxylase [Enterococcus faecalis]BDH64637.1 aminotransferase [Enterococcus sp. PLM3]EGO2751715.1 aspartate 4-decarboxylase [Enterococcus faecalis]EGO5110007.1 aspartate 4-decarboxylase [Enterococcus faecalis]EGO6072820.1 aspartate 4-decarboxylase [Enterococcus faecalis]EGO6776477.1 aspartate 4-decarboxylase [Enterococcus faecalis]